MRTKSLLTAALVAATLTLSATAHAATWTIDPGALVGRIHGPPHLQQSARLVRQVLGHDRIRSGEPHGRFREGRHRPGIDQHEDAEARRSSPLRRLLRRGAVPAMSFASTKVTKGEGNELSVEGNLTMHGVTKPVTLAGDVLGAGPSMGGQRAGFEATTKIDRKEFGIVWNRPIDNGMLLSDDVAISIGIEAYIPGREVVSDRVRF